MSTTTTISEKTQAGVFNTYRAALKSANAISQQYGNRNSRVASRKQQARVIASHRYNLPISQVKKLVQAEEAKRGITHEHPEQYQKELEYAQKAQALEQETAGITECPNLTSDLVRCSDLIQDDPHFEALVREDHDDILRVRVNPYELNIYDNLKPVFSCFRCWRVLESEI